MFSVRIGDSPAYLDRLGSGAIGPGVRRCRLVASRRQRRQQPTARPARLPADHRARRLADRQRPRRATVEMAAGAAWSPARAAPAATAATRAAPRPTPAGQAAPADPVASEPQTGAMARTAVATTSLSTVAQRRRRRAGTGADPDGRCQCSPGGCRVAHTSLDCIPGQRLSVGTAIPSTPSTSRSRATISVIRGGADRDRLRSRSP